MEVLQLVSQGHSDKEIARSLGLSPRTVEMHAGNALHALNCRTRAEGVQQAMRLGLLG
jgi:DNA-binding CsgD family transcriptional regulator